MAMLWLIAPWARENGIETSVATVDHGLRPEAAEEARFVAGVCAGLGLPHQTLRWRGWQGQGNLQAAARDARRELLAQWARNRGIDVILLGHTEDDQAETVLMRIARGSGVDGLSGMRQRWRERDLDWLRPLLLLSRRDLRAFLRRQGRAWVDDPSNQDEGFARVRARKALACLSDLGITASGLTEMANRQRVARQVLERFAEEAAERLVTTTAGDVVISDSDPSWLPPETEFRLWAAAIRWVASTTYRPRHHSLAMAQADARLGHRRSLGGTLVRFRGEGRSRAAIIGREPRAVASTVSATTEPWDTRWRLSGPHSPELQVRMLGEAGIALCPDWRAAGLERSSVLASPAIWWGQTLVAAPLAGQREGWTAEVATPFSAALREGWPG